MEQNKNYEHSSNILLIVIMLFISFCGSALYSQQTHIQRYMVVRTAPVFMLSVNGSLSLSALELGGTYNSDFHSELVKEGESFGTRNGIGLTVSAKENIHKSSKYWLTQSIAYNNLKSYLFNSAKTNSDKGSASYNVFTAAAGGEYNILPSYSFKIFVGAELNASLISGSIDVWVQDPSDPYNTDSYKILPSFRMGLGITAGTNYMLSNKVGFNFAAKYSYLNAFLKSSEGSSFDTEFRLRDAMVSNDLLFSGKKRFTFFSFQAGISFYFGINEKYYKLN